MPTKKLLKLVWVPFDPSFPVYPKICQLLEKKNRLPQIWSNYTSITRTFVMVNKRITKRVLEKQNTLRYSSRVTYWVKGLQ